MNIQVPKSIKSPTVVIVGKEDSNDQITLKRIDLLEKNLNKQYQLLQDKNNLGNIVEKLNGAFLDRLDKIVSINRQYFSKVNIDRFSSLRKEFFGKISELKKENNSDKQNEILSAFVKKVNSLKEDIAEVKQSVKKDNGQEEIYKAFIRQLGSLGRKIDTIRSSVVAPIDESRPLEDTFNRIWRKKPIPRLIPYVS